MQRFTPWLCRVAVLAALCFSLNAQGRGWVYLGDSHIDGAVDHDRIQVGQSQGAFRAIQLRVNGGTVFFQRVIVRYGNNTQQEVPVRFAIAPGARTRTINLPGDRRIIESVDVWYRKARWLKRPKVSLFGHS